MGTRRKVKTGGKTEESNHTGLTFVNLATINKESFVTEILLHLLNTTDITAFVYRLYKTINEQIQHQQQVNNAAVYEVFLCATELIVLYHCKPRCCN